MKNIKLIKIPNDFDSKQGEKYIKLYYCVVNYAKEKSYNRQSIINMLRDFIRYDVLDDYDEISVIKQLDDIKKINSKAITLDKMKLKYGNDEGLKRYNAYCHKQAKSNTFEYKNKKYGMSREEFDNFNKSRAITIDNMINKYGEVEGTKRYNDYCNRQAYTNTLNYFIEKYGHDKGKKEYKRVCSEKAHTLDNYIKMYGETIGIKKYKEYIDKISKRTGLISAEETAFIDKLIKKLPESDKHYRQYGKLFNNTYYLYDYVNTEFKICVEYNGSIWHANPKIYKPNDKPLTFVGNNLTSKEIWLADKIKNDYLIKCSSIDKIFIVWDNDDHEQKINEICDYVKGLKID